MSEGAYVHEVINKEVFIGSPQTEKEMGFYPLLSLQESNPQGLVKTFFMVLTPPQKKPHIRTYIHTCMHTYI